MRQSNPSNVNPLQAVRLIPRGQKDVIALLTMLPDLEKYRPYVDGFDMMEDQKTELIHTLWGIMESFADQAFGLHPVRLCRNGGAAEISIRHTDAVNSKAPLIEGTCREAADESGGEMP